MSTPNRATERDDITIADLREQYRRSRLWVRGWSFERALEVPAIVTALICGIHARQRKTCAMRLPQQPRLI